MDWTHTNSIKKIHEFNSYLFREAKERWSTSFYPNLQLSSREIKLLQKIFPMETEWPWMSFLCWTSSHKKDLWTKFHFWNLKKIGHSVQLCLWRPSTPPPVSHQPISSTYGGGEELIWYWSEEPKSTTKSKSTLTFPKNWSFSFDSSLIQQKYKAQAIIAFFLLSFD